MSAIAASIYRLRSPNLRHAIKTDLVAGSTHELRVADRPALRVDRVADLHLPRWATALAEMTGRPFLHEVRAAGSVLLIDLDGSAYALAFGTGWRMLRPEAWEPDFGLRVAIRALQPDRVAEVVRTALDAGARLDLTHMPGGRRMRTFGVEEYRDIVKRIGGKCSMLDITYRKGRSQVKLDGSDALRLTVAADPTRLVEDLRAIERASQLDPAPELAFIEGIRPLAAGNHRYGVAERALRDALATARSDRVGLALPSSLLATEFSELLVDVDGRSTRLTDIDIADIAGLLAGVPAVNRLDALRAGRVTVRTDDPDEDVDTPLSQWIAADLVAGDDRYIYHDGKFYVVTEEYRRVLAAEAARLMAQRPSWRLPPWPRKEHERAYNEQVGAEAGFVNLDRNLTRSETHRSGIEICDLVSPDNQLVCVKRANKSAPLSHLFSQAVVAADALLDGAETRRKLLDKLPADRRSEFPDRPNFVFAIQLPRELTPDALFTFSQATLHHTAKYLNRLGMQVSVMAIPAR